MNEDGCCSSGVWNVHSDISLKNMSISVYYWDYLQVGLCSVAYYCSSGLNWFLDQNDNL